MKRMHAKKGLRLAGVLAAVLAIGATPMSNVAPAQAQASQTPSREIVLSIGRGQLVSLPTSISDLFIANEAVADVQVKSARQIYIFGKSGGETTLYASNAAGDIVYSATVRVGSNIDSIDQMLALAMPESKISVATMNGLVLLTGTIASPDDGAEAERLVQAFVGEDTRVVSRLKTATPLQVNLQVRVAEVSRTLVKAMANNFTTQDSTSGFRFGASRAGRDFGSFNGSTTFFNGLTAAQVARLPVLDASSLFNLPPGSISLPFNTETGRFITSAGEEIPGFTFNNTTNGNTTLAAVGRLFGVDVAAAFDLSERLGLVNTLSQPNLTALSGETADFLAGGEFPIPISQGFGTTTIEYRNFGVSLAYTPTVLSNGRISLRVRPEVSELSNAGSVTLGGFVVPGLTIRRAETTVELGSGQSFMIAGLMSNDFGNTVTKTPGLGDLPILGNLFKSSEYSRGETELVIVVTPYLVEPVDANDIVLPTDALQSANDLQRLIVNQDTDGITGGDRPKPQVEDSPVDGPDLGALGSKDAPPPRRAQKKGEGQDVAAAPGFSFE